MFEHTPPPTPEQQAWWIAQLRIAFPTLDIQCGIWEDRMQRVALLLKAGANSISKFQALKLFGTEVCYELERQTALAERKFQGTVTRLPEVDWEGEVEKLSLDANLKTRIKKKLCDEYLREMKKNAEKKILSVIT